MKTIVYTNIVRMFAQELHVITSKLHYNYGTMGN